MHIDEEKWDAGLLEKYVLGLCNATEKHRVESLIARNPELLEKVDEMHKAVKCYCSSCYSDKVKSILRGQNEMVNCKSSVGPARMKDLPEEKHPTILRKLIVYLRRILPFSN
ncbi:MAG: hypothetical protein KDC80_19020 [Saprospiraceae bacterium]|nr:hypothetical protein [Saprospiraceae bacterium]